VTTIPFEIEFVFRRRPTVVFARILESQDFGLVEGARLGGVPIAPVVTAPRALDADGQPRTDIFAFTLQSGGNVESFAPGVRVSLVIPG